jgi:hypothetical protein
LQAIGAPPIFFVECDSIEVPYFDQEKMQAILDQSISPLCPSSLDFNIDGVFGTSLWVLPKHDLSNEVYQRHNNFVDVKVVTNHFNVDSYDDPENFYKPVYEVAF